MIVIYEKTKDRQIWCNDGYLNINVIIRYCFNIKYIFNDRGDKNNG